MTISLIQSSFQFGEVSELLRARVESPIYYRGVKRLRDMQVIPQGGAERRFGLEYVATVSDNAMPPNYITDYRVIKPFIFDYEDGADYFLIFKASSVEIYYNNEFQGSCVTPYTADEIKDLSLTQSSNIVFIAHGNHPPATLTRFATGPIQLTYTVSTFTTYPTFDFVNNYSAYTFTVTKGGSPLTTTDNLLGQVVTLTSSTAMFNANYVGGLFIAEGGTLRFTAMTDTSNMVARIVNVFDTESSLFHGSNTILGEDAIVTEVVFSSARGYPQAVSFFQNRLYLAKTRTLLSGLWGSNYNGYSATTLNFDDSDILDTNAVSTVLQGNGNKATVIQHLVSFKSLLVFTTSGMYSSPLLGETPIVPTNVNFINPQTADSANSVTPLVFDNDVIFFDKGGRKVKNANIAEPTQHYQTKNISVLAPHLVDQPYSAAVFENSGLKDGSWMFMVNSGTSTLSDGQNMEGTLSVYQNVPEQEINAWSLCATDGKFRHVVSDEEVVYFIIERVIDGDTRLFIEQLNFDAMTDAALLKTQTLSTTVTGLDYLEGKTVSVLGKGADMTRKGPMANQVVTGGEITVEYAVTEVEVGLYWAPVIVPLPLNVAMPNGPNLYMPKSVASIYIDFYQSTGITVNGNLIPPFRFEEDQVGEPPLVQTDFVEVTTFGGWNPRQEIIISQDVPQPLTVIGLGLNVKV